MIQINKRSIGVCILLSIITGGIYLIYWMYLLVKNTRSIQMNTGGCVGEMLCLMYVPFYFLYWWYTRGKRVEQSFSKNNYKATGNGVVYLILAILGLNIVSMAIMQSDFNSLKESGTALDVNAVKAEINALKAEKKELKAKEKSEQNIITNFTIAAKPYLDAERNLVQMENYSHLEEIFSMYEEAKAKA